MSATGGFSRIIRLHRQEYQALEPTGLLLLHVRMLAVVVMMMAIDDEGGGNGNGGVGGGDTDGNAGDEVAEHVEDDVADDHDAYDD